MSFQGKPHLSYFVLCGIWLSDSFCSEASWIFLVWRLPSQERSEGQVWLVAVTTCIYVAGKFSARATAPNAPGNLTPMILLHEKCQEVAENILLCVRKSRIHGVCGSFHQKHQHHKMNLSYASAYYLPFEETEASQVRREILRTSSVSHCQFISSVQTFNRDQWFRSCQRE